MSSAHGWALSACVSHTPFLPGECGNGAEAPVGRKSGGTSPSTGVSLPCQLDRSPKPLMSNLNPPFHCCGLTVEQRYPSPNRPASLLIQQVLAVPCSLILRLHCHKALARSRQCALCAPGVNSEWRAPMLPRPWTHRCVPCTRRSSRVQANDDKPDIVGIRSILLFIP